MKTKLLRKVRKEYSIVYCPFGCGNIEESVIVLLHSNFLGAELLKFLREKYYTQAQAVDVLKRKMLDLLHKKYSWYTRKEKLKHSKTKNVKLWRNT